MKIVKINQANLEEQVQETSQLIKKGGAVIYPTDTVYGLGVDALNKKAIERLIKIKGRSDGKPIPIIIRDIEMASQVA
ncbi:MAG TPA: hypothetical protein ENI16_00905 [Candidatus Portnoybacteria bacterium]|nr:hypothetical protein [Candidatus Portnoybacteria bacterium]